MMPQDLHLVVTALPALRVDFHIRRCVFTQTKDGTLRQMQWRPLTLIGVPAFSSFLSIRYSFIQLKVKHHATVCLHQNCVSLFLSTLGSKFGIVRLVVGEQFSKIAFMCLVSQDFQDFQDHRELLWFIRVFVTSGLFWFVHPSKIFQPLRSNLFLPKPAG